MLGFHQRIEMHAMADDVNKPATGGGSSEQVPSGNQNKRVEANYTAEDLQHLSDLEHVRERPSMYIGDTTIRGLHHLVYEVVDNSIDEAMAGHAKQVTVTINNDGSVTVEDDGRGIPVEMHPDLGVSTLQGVMTVLKFGGKFSKGAYQTSGGLHGVGVTVVNFLSEWCEVEVCRDGHVYQQEYERGVPTGEVRRIGTTDQGRHQDHLQARPADLSHHQVRLQHAAPPLAGTGVSQPRREDHLSRRTDRRRRNVPLRTRHSGVRRVSQPGQRAGASRHHLHRRAKYERRRLELAMQYSTEYTENVHSYVNNINTIEGGTHVSGFRAALTRTLNAYGKKENLFKDLAPTGDDFREGLTAVISLRVPEPQFEGQTKTKLGNSEVEGIVNSAVGDFLPSIWKKTPRAPR